MSLIEALILGLIQGLTEFFPVSSSSHLKFAKMFLGIQAPEEQLVAFDLFCHLGTLMALIWFFKKEILHLFRQPKSFVPYLLALVPLIPLYFLLHPLREYASSTLFTGPLLITTALLLFLGHWIKIYQSKTKPNRDALLIGVMQSFALIPGISRSASTISCAKVLGWNPKEAVHFSFLLSIPTILGGCGLQAVKLNLLLFSSAFLLQCTMGFLVAFVTGLCIVRIALYWLEKGNLKPFGWYCLFLGIAATIKLNLL